MVRVLLAEDHKIVRQGTRLYLESVGIDVIGEATTGREAVEMARDLQPDVVIMDIHMPELTGVEATRRIRHENDQIRVLALTAYNEPAYVQALLEAGADGFVLKTAELSELLKALREVATGHSAFDAQMLAKASQQGEAPVMIEGLTDRELEVLTCAARGLTNKQIGQQLFISDRTVQGHLQNIYQKMNVTTRTEAVTLALKHGLIMLGNDNAE
ncbi:MAG: response regulator transcription factor [bacterium]|nr:response regulator transcription factor [bacterium]